MIASLFSGDVRVIECNSLGDSHFQICVMNNVEIMTDYYLHIMLGALFSLDELIFLHFASFSYVVHVVWELFIIFDHMILIFKSHAFDRKD